jgi:hypothetical protein
VLPEASAACGTTQTAARAATNFVFETMDLTIMPSPEVLLATNWGAGAPATTPQAAGAARFGDRLQPPAANSRGKRLINSEETRKLRRS